MVPPAGGKKVVGLGLACLDQRILWRDASEPVAGNRIVEWGTQGGGMVGTALVAVARLGTPAEYWGAVGDDWMAEMIVAGLAEESVDTSQVRRTKGFRGPMVVVCVDQPTGERHFLHAVGLGVWGEPIVPADRLAGAGCILVDNTQPPSQLEAARAAHRLGVPVVGDVGNIHAPAREVLACTDYAIVSEGCARSLGAGDDFGLACRMIRDMGPRCVAVTLGDRGLVYLDGDRAGRMDAFPVEVVDTTGAGDTFHGAFCCGLVEGLALTDNLAFSSAVAAMKCRRLGGRTGIPSRSEAVQFLAERGVGLPASFIRAGQDAEADR